MVTHDVGLPQDGATTTPTSSTGVVTCESAPLEKLPPAMSIPPQAVTRLERIKNDENDRAGCGNDSPLRARDSARFLAHAVQTSNGIIRRS
jgi:hypothetical protein